VRFEHWQLRAQPKEETHEGEILNYYQADIAEVKKEKNYKFVDVISVKKTDSFASARRNHFLSEHTHTEDEVRLFLSGTVLIYLHIQARIHILQCGRGDFLTIPKGVKHWLDMGPDPEYSCIRWFNSEEGVKNQLTENCIAESTPRWETILGNTHCK
jgi:1,2-dihydroxy-3-keto-5-methylthiopentene dioxygenase